MLALPPSVVLGEAQALLGTLRRTIADNSADPLIVDASVLHEFDSSALAVLLECRRLAQSSSRGFVLRDPPARLKQLARLYGVGELLGIEVPAPQTIQPA